MKYLCHVTGLITSIPEADNHRGEPRWERNSFAALLTAGRQVHTTMPVWNSPIIPPVNLHDGINSAWQDDSVLITYGVREHTHITTSAKHYIVNYLDGPSKEMAHSLSQYKSFVAICNWNAWVYMDRLKDVFGSENVEWVQGPFVPRVYNTDNFDQKYLLWPWRNFWKFTENEPDNLTVLFHQLSKYLDSNPILRIGIVLGWYRPEILADPARDGKNWVMDLACMKDMGRHRDRIDVFSGLHWYEMLNLFRQTRLVISPSESLGCPAYEAAAYGIPTVLDVESNPFQDPTGKQFFEGVLTAPRTICTSFLEQIDALFNHHSLYTKHGNAYRDYVGQTATYAAYVRQIDSIMQKRGWVS